MSLPRLNRPTQIADRLNELFAVVKTRSRASLTDASHILETVARRFFNALYGWELVNLNTEQANFPAADLGDRKRRIAIQITVQESPDKITHTAAKAKEHKLGKAFDRLIVFFLLPKKPNFPKRFTQPADGPKIETRDITELLEELKEMDDLITLTTAARVLDEELGKIRDSVAVSVPPEAQACWATPTALSVAPATAHWPELILTRWPCVNAAAATRHLKPVEFSVVVIAG